MRTKDITVNEEVYHCSMEWIVEQVEIKIRSRFGLRKGGIEVPVLGSVSIGSFRGSLAFAGGSEAGKFYSYPPLSL